MGVNLNPKPYTHGCYLGALLGLHQGFLKLLGRRGLSSRKFWAPGALSPLLRLRFPGLKVGCLGCGVGG